MCAFRSLARLGFLLFDSSVALGAQQSQYDFRLAAPVPLAGVKISVVEGAGLFARQAELRWHSQRTNAKGQASIGFKPRGAPWRPAMYCAKIEHKFYCLSVYEHVPTAGEVGFRMHELVLNSDEEPVSRFSAPLDCQYRTDSERVTTAGAHYEIEIACRRP